MKFERTVLWIVVMMALLLSIYNTFAISWLTSTIELINECQSVILEILDVLTQTVGWAI